MSEKNIKNVSISLGEYERLIIREMADQSDRTPHYIMRQAISKAIAEFCVCKTVKPSTHNENNK